MKYPPLKTACAAALLLALSATAHAAYPERPITLVVPTAAGGAMLCWRAW